MHLAVLALAVVACTQQSRPDTVTIPPGAEVSVVGSFDWSVPDRFGLDGDGDGRLDVPNSLEYVLNLEAGSCASGCADVVPVFNVELDASEVSLVASDVEVPIDGYEWTLEGNGDIKVVASESAQAVVELPEGSYDTRLEIRGGGRVHTVAGIVEVSDLLIVSVGDSFASGEGNPELPGDPARWADDGLEDGSPQEVAHDMAHRSSLAGPVQAALAIERSDPHTSVTFLFLAASGASIEEGLLGSGAEIVGSDGQRRSLRPQLELLADLVGCRDEVKTCQRQIDSLLISAGGNDIGFSFTLGSLIVLDPLLAINPIYETLLNNLVTDVESQIAQLPLLFNAVTAAVAELNPGQVYLTAYPDSSRVAEGGRLTACDSVGNDLISGLEIDREELELVMERILLPLNATLESVASEAGWVFVDDHLAAFSGHGYCGSDPYKGGAFAGSPFPDPVMPNSDPGSRWFRQAGDSVSIQGGGGAFSPERLGTTGTFHPNEFGHHAYKEALLQALGTG